MEVNVDNGPNGICTISMDNSIITKGWIFKSIQYNFDDDPMPRFIKVIRHYVRGDEMFFWHNRIDGINLTSEEEVQYSKEIPDYFRANGRYEPIPIIVKKRKKIKTYEGYMTVGSLPVNDKMYEMLPKIFHYYLETICFCPNIEWEMFAQSYRGYMQHGAEDYAINGYTDFLFTYVDSGIFSVSFNSNVYDPKVIYEEINRIIR